MFFEERKEKFILQIQVPVSGAEEDLVRDAIFNAIEGPFTGIGKALADFLGHLENKTMNFKDDHDNP